MIMLGAGYNEGSGVGAKSMKLNQGQLKVS